MQALIATLAQRHGVRRFERTDPGSCRCKGGTGNCNGCEMVPIHTELQRVPGKDGRDGSSGQSIATPLSPGSMGVPGKATFYVRNHGGSDQEYTSLYQLELLDFDVEDENGDGIFEPGEHLFIRRIRIRNTGKHMVPASRLTTCVMNYIAGGMPSPKRPITMSIIRSEWFLPIPGDESHAIIPGSIMPGDTKTLASFIKVLIRPFNGPQSPGQQFFRNESLSIQATMPWLNRTLPHFEYFRRLDIQFPIELGSFHILPAMAQGSVNHFSYEVSKHPMRHIYPIWSTSNIRFQVLNKGSRPLGVSSSLGRHIEAHITLPQECGSLLSTMDTWESQADYPIARLAAEEAVTKNHTLHIAVASHNYHSITIHVSLYLSIPKDRVAITHLLAEFTKCSDHVFEHARLQARDIVPRTEWCSPKEWDRRWEAGNTEKERIKEETNGTWEILEKMVVRNEAALETDIESR